MPSLPHDLYTSSQVRELDRTAIERFGIPGDSLMQRAGRAAFDLLRVRWPEARQVCVVCGTGNNGGDGYVVARLALDAGLDVQVVQLGDTTRIAGDAKLARERYLEAGGREQAFEDALPDADVIVDALLGTGLEREVAGPWRAAIELANARVAARLAIDTPSGLSSDTGRVLGAAMRADATISFIGLKRGLVTGDALDCVGDLYFDDLEVPAEVYSAVEPTARLLASSDLHQALPPRDRTSHKGAFGHVLVVGGDHGMGGAARMAAEAAARVGAGLTSVATRAVHVPAILAARPELMVRSVDGRSELEPLLERASVIAIGPGLGRSPWARDLLGRVLETDAPLVLDADALNLLAEEPIRRANWILTPHPGEAARLLESTTQGVQDDRFAAVEALVRRFGGVCVLKGAGTLVHGEGRTTVCRPGNPGMASGGMGDVLTGVVAGLAAQGLELGRAAELGVYLHALAGDRAAALGGERGLLATDLLPELRRLVNP